MNDAWWESELPFLERLLDEVPEDQKITRASLASRIEHVKMQIVYDEGVSDE